MKRRLFHLAAALSLLLRHVPEERQAEARRELLDALKRISDASGAPRPEWLKRV